MRTVGQLRHERSIPIPVNPDSIYKPIERPNRVFNRLQVPKQLQAALPFKSKPKIEAPRKRSTLEQRRAVVMEPEEKRLATLVQQLNTIRNDRSEKTREKAERRKQRREGPCQGTDVAIGVAEGDEEEEVQGGGTGGEAQGDEDARDEVKRASEERGRRLVLIGNLPSENCCKYRPRSGRVMDISPGRNPESSQTRNDESYQIAGIAG